MTFDVGDFVGRVEGQGKYTRGRITGFAPNGMARVKVSETQSRIWPVRSLQRTITDVGHLGTTVSPRLKARKNEPKASKEDIVGTQASKHTIPPVLSATSRVDPRAPLNPRDPDYLVKAANWKPVPHPVMASCRQEAFRRPLDRAYGQLAFWNGYEWLPYASAEWREGWMEACQISAMLLRNGGDSVL